MSKKEELAIKRAERTASEILEEHVFLRDDLPDVPKEGQTFVKLAILVLACEKIIRVAHTFTQIMMDNEEEKGDLN